MPPKPQLTGKVVLEELCNYLTNNGKDSLTNDIDFINMFYGSNESVIKIQEYCVNDKGTLENVINFFLGQVAKHNQTVDKKTNWQLNYDQNDRKTVKEFIKVFLKKHGFEQSPHEAKPLGEGAAQEGITQQQSQNNLTPNDAKKEHLKQPFERFTTYLQAHLDELTVEDRVVANMLCAKNFFDTIWENRQALENPKLQDICLYTLKVTKNKLPTFFKVPESDRKQPPLSDDQISTSFEHLFYSYLKAIENLKRNQDSEATTGNTEITGAGAAPLNEPSAKRSPK